MFDKRFSPKEFLKSRRPERFSDSSTVDEPVIDRSALEYHLDTITNRGQDHDFEEFARHLCQLEICPNLIPHTGPTGGGDSKVDTETFPVAEVLALAWFSGFGKEAADQRWAFAFSAKMDWRGKVNSDIKKIAGTDRNYKRAFFVTSRFVPDKTRAEVEDSLERKFGIDVRILDRTWILDRVFAGQHEDLVISDLRIATSARRMVKPGPRDLQRREDLDVCETRLGQFLNDNLLGPALVEASLEAALLARGLELPRHEVIGRFVRADQLATRYGTLQQQLDCTYARAWTTFWWFEDPDEFLQLYEAFETVVASSDNPFDLERYANLWYLLHASSHRGDLDADKSGLEAKTARIVESLERLSLQPGRPSAALQAEALLVMVRLAGNVSGGEAAFAALDAIVRRCEGLIGFPLQNLAQIILELGDVFGDSKAYDRLYETLVGVTSKREGELSGARLLTTRGAQHLNADRPYEAIGVLGRALRDLYKHESRRELVSALYLCGCAYERVGLLWAARGALLTAASVATAEFHTYGKPTSLQPACYERLKWLELNLGRIPQALAWHEVDRAARGALASLGYDSEILRPNEMAFDAGLGVLFLRQDLWSLNRLTMLPAALERLDLVCAACALKYALGHDASVQEDIADGVPDGNIDAFFRQLMSQPIAADLPPAIVDTEGRRTTLTSRILGCRVQVEVDNGFPTMDLAESLLAAAESFLATGMARRIIAREPSLTVDVRRSDLAATPFEFLLSDRGGRPHVEVRCSQFGVDQVSLADQAALKARLWEVVAHLVGRCFVVENIEGAFEKLFEEERVHDRALDFTSSFVTLTNVLGHEPKDTITKWVETGDAEYPLIRSESWAAAGLEVDSHEGAAGKRGILGEGEPPSDLLDAGRARHDEMETVSLIRDSLWNRAGWMGTAFIMDRENRMRPILALVFTDEAAGREIFAHLRSELGGDDNVERLTVTIIQGISATKPHSYRVVIGSSFDEAAAKSDTKYKMFRSRLNTMVPITSTNLQLFLESYAAKGEYLLAPAIGRGSETFPDLLADVGIVKRRLRVREAWQIGRNDLDIVGVDGDDDPIIPPEQTARAPVLAVLRWKRDQQSKSP